MSSEKRCVEHIGRRAVHDHRLVAFDGISLLGGDEASLDVGEVTAYRLRREDAGAVGDDP